MLVASVASVAVRRPVQHANNNDDIMALEALSFDSSLGLAVLGWGRLW